MSGGTRKHRRLARATAMLLTAVAAAAGGLAGAGAAWAAPEAQTQAPAAASGGPNSMWVAIRGDDDRLWTTAWNGTAWPAWTIHDDLVLTAAPAVAVRGAETDVFAKVAGGELWRRTYAAGRWSAWSSLGGCITSAPAAAVRRDSGVLDVVARGCDGSVWIISRDAAGTWSPWASIGGATAHPPGITSGVSRSIHVYVTGTDGRVHQKTWSPSAGWSVWIAVGGAGLTSGPAATSQWDGVVDTFTRNADGDLSQFSWNGTAWESGILKTAATSGPGAASEGRGRVALFARRGVEVVANAFADGRWGGWGALPTATVKLSASPAGPVGPGPGPATPPTPGAPNGSGGDRGTARFEVTPKAARRTVRYGAKVTLRGRLVDGAGTPIAGAALRVTETVQAARAQPLEAAPVTTAADGTFTVTPSSTGSSRSVQLAYAPLQGAAPTATTDFALTVAAKLTFTLSRRTARLGATVRMSGRVRVDPLPARRVRILLQSQRQDRRGWIDAKTLRARADGTFAWSHRFRTPGRYVLRARILEGSGMAAQRSTSAAVRLRVR